ncbi:MAG TPA: hypothetical protein PLP31_11835 [Thermoanaerobaculaceae bacterium]|nr:hypothetical protein [Thermoanaerobaculaceae bacterium]
MRPPSAVLREALHCYAAGHVADALRVLDAIPAGDPLPDHPAWDVATVERRADAPAAPATVSAAVRDLIELARDRLRHELGEDVPAAVPVPLALTTALDLLGW